MNKNLKKIILIALSVIVIFCAGSFVGASSVDWKTKLSVDAAADINQAGKAKTDELTLNLQENIGIKVMEKVDPIIEAKKLELEAAIQAYFDSKVDGITDSPAYIAAVADLDRIQTNLLANYKTKIDQAFAGQ